MKKSYIKPVLTTTRTALTEIIATSVGFGGEEGPTIDLSEDILIRGEELPMLPSFGGQEEW